MGKCYMFEAYKYFLTKEPTVRDCKNEHSARSFSQQESGLGRDLCK
jgi:hypothetical protein